MLRLLILFDKYNKSENYIRQNKPCIGIEGLNNRDYTFINKIIMIICLNIIIEPILFWLFSEYYNYYIILKILDFFCKMYFSLALKCGCKFSLVTSTFAERRFAATEWAAKWQGHMWTNHAERHYGMEERWLEVRVLQIAAKNEAGKGWTRDV